MMMEMKLTLISMLKHKVLLMHTKELEEVQDLIDKLNPENPLNADEFVQYDNFRLTAEMISDEEILKAILPNNQEKEVEEYRY